MASNVIPRTYVPLVALGEDAADGAQAHEAALGLKQNTESAIRADLGGLIVAQGAVANQRLAKAEASEAKATADAGGKAFISRFMDFMRPRFGSGWGPLWELAGFSNGSISMPTRIDDRFVLLGKMRRFLESHPENEVRDAARPELDVTEAVAAGLYEDFSNGRSAYNEAVSENGALLATRDEAIVKMRHRLTGLREELTQLQLDGESPIWHAFGFSRPADPEAPEVPGGLMLRAGAAGSGDLMAEWGRARRGTGYRVKVQVEGEAEARMFGLFEDHQAAIRGLPLGMALVVTVIAHNEAGDGRESAAERITLI